MRYKVNCVYHAEVEMEIEGDPDSNMMDPSNWGEIVHEWQKDFTLYDVDSFEPIEEDD